MSIFPQPKVLRERSHSFPTPSSLVLHSTDSISGSLPAAAASVLAVRCPDLAIHGLQQQPPSNDGYGLELALSRNIKRAEEYRFALRQDRGRIEAASEAALFYGLVSAAQHLASPSSQVCEIDVEDWPDLPHRGFMLDVSRCKVPTQESLYELVDRLASLKYNQLQLYTEHTFAYKAHEDVWRDASPLTAQEVRDLGVHCRMRHIELVPNQNSFGHMERWLRHDRYKPLAECPNGFEHPLLGSRPHGGTLKPSKESLQFIASLYRELLPNFDSRYFNVGCDETWELGQGWSRPQAETKGARRVYLEFLLQIAELVRGFDRTMMFWGDIILEAPELARELPMDVIALIWGYEADHPFASQCERFKKNGVPFYVVPGTSSWNSIGGRYQNAHDNIEAANQCAIASGAIGCLLTEWGDGGHHQPQAISFPALVWNAGLAWGLQENRDAAIDKLAAAFLIGGRSESLAQAIAQLGRCHEPLQRPLRNATWLNRILLTASPALERELEGIPASAFDSCMERIEQAKALAQDKSASGSPNIKEDLALACDLLAFAVRKGKSIASGRPIRPSEQRAEIQPLADRFRDAWLARNRPGGLDESVDNLLRPAAG